MTTSEPRVAATCGQKSQPAPPARHPDNGKWQGIRGEAKDALSHYWEIVAGRQAQVINALTIVATVFLPLSFLTGYRARWTAALPTMASWTSKHRTSARCGRPPKRRNWPRPCLGPPLVRGAVARP